MNVISLIMLVALLTACGGGGGSSSDSSKPIPTKKAMSFNGFVDDMLEHQDDEVSDPVAVNALEFQFEEDDDAFPQLF